MIIITALLVASLLLSTAIYIIETEKEVPTTGTDENNVLTEYEQSIKNTLISALANITNGGDPSVLTADLNELNAAITSHSYQAMLQMDYTPLNTLHIKMASGFHGEQMVKEFQALMSISSLTLQLLQQLPIWNIL